MNMCFKDLKDKTLNTMKEKIAALPEGEKTGVRWIYPRHWDYWFSVYGLLEGKDHPCLLEFAIFPDRVDNALVVDEYFHLDVGNFVSADAFIRDEWNEWNSEEEKRRFAEQTERLRRGETEYFIANLYYPNQVWGQYYMDCLPRGKSVFDIKNKIEDAPYYGEIYIREARPLIPEVLENWMERLSPVLFGDYCAYKIPEEEYPDSEEVQKEYKMRRL